MKRLLIMPIIALSLGIIGCTNTNNKAGMDTKKLIEYKESYIGDNSAVSNIIKSLPGKDYFKSIELQTKEKPYSVTITYKNFDDINVELLDEKIVNLQKDKIIYKNSEVMFALIPNVDEINFKFEGGGSYTYQRDEQKVKHEIVSDESSIENFVKE